MNGRQVPVHDIKGGIHPDADAQRIKNNSWVTLENAEYDRQGRLVKSPYLSSCVGSFSGDIRDILKTYSGYLIAGYNLQYASDILAAASIARVFTDSSPRSKLIEAPNRSVYYVNSDGILRRWTPNTDYGIDLLAGIPPPTTLPIARQSLLADNVWRVGVQDLANNDSSILMSLDVPGGGVDVTYRPTNHYIGSDVDVAPTSPTSAYDADVNTYAILQGNLVSGSLQRISTLVVYGFEAPPYTFTSFNLKVKTHHPSLSGASLEYSLDGGVSWTEIRGWTTDWDGTDTIALSASQDITKVQVRLSNKDAGDRTIDGTFFAAAPSYLYDVRIEASGGTATTGAASLEFTILGDVMTVVGREAFKAINIPIKTNNLSSARDIVVTITEYYGDTSTIRATESKTVSVSTAATSIQTPDFTETFYLTEDGSRKVVIGLSYAGAGVADTLVFYRAIQWFTSKVFMTNETTGETIYLDRDPLIAFRLTGELLDGKYDYGFSLRGQGEFESNNAPTNSLTQVSGKTHYFNLEDFIITLAENGAFGINTAVILNRTLVGGGTVYRLREFTRTTIEDYSSYADAFTGTWDMVTPLILPPNRIVDGYPLGTATPALEDADSPNDLWFFPDTLVRFRSRLFGLVEIEDNDGNLTTFIRYSEVDIYDYFSDLNEISIPDNLIGLCPLREDMLLAFSDTRVYRVFPSGTGFEWVKIADVGLGDVRLVGATNESVIFANNFGLYVFDGSVVSILPASNDVLSLIRTAISNGGTLNISLSLQKVFISLHEQLGEGLVTTLLVLDTFVKAITTMVINGSLTSISDINKVSYFGIIDDIRYRGTLYNSITTIKSKRFASNDLNRIQLFYMGIRHLITAFIDGEGSGYGQNILYINFTFSTGKVVGKTVDLSDGTAGDIKQTMFEIYGEGDWFEFEISHSDRANFSILDYVLGALPIDLVFDEGVQNA